MTIETRVEGAEKLGRVAKALKQAGDRDLSKQLTKGLTTSVKPLKKDVKSSTNEFLPRGGGLARRVRRTALPHRVRKGRDPSVKITAKPSSRTLRDPFRADRGRIRHPVFGMAASRAPWVLQNVRPGWFTTPLEEGAPEVRKQLVRQLDELTRQIERSV